MVWLIAGCAWLGCGALSAGMYYAHFQREYWQIAEISRADDTSKALIFAGLSGPVGLLATFICGFYRHGWLMPGTAPKERR